MNRTPPWALSLAVASLVLAVPLAAQQQTSLTGTVRDESGQPIAHAEVFVDRSDTPVLTDESGTFRIADIRPGSFWVAVRSIGFRPARRAVTVRRNRAATVELVMTALPVTLNEIVVQASGMDLRRLDEFWRRSRSGWGVFLTQERLRNSAYLSQIVGPYLALSRGARPETLDLFWRPANDALDPTIGGCTPAVSLNGRPPLEGWYVDDLRVEDVEALEVYRPGGNRIPVDYSFYRRAEACGLVVAWLRS